MANNLFANLFNKITDNTFATKEDTTMANNTINNTTVNAANNKEEKTMTRAERFEAMKAETKRQILAASNKSGYGVGFGTTTVKLEVQGLASKVKAAITGTEVAQEFGKGYVSGKDKAVEAYAQRCVVREENRRAREEEKLAREAMKADIVDLPGVAPCDLQAAIANGPF